MSSWSLMSPHMFFPYLKQEIFMMICYYFICHLENFVTPCCIFQLWNTFNVLFLILYVMSAREWALWFPLLTDQARTFLGRKTEWRWPLRKELDGKVFACRQSRHFSFVENMVEVNFFTLSLDLLCIFLCFPPCKGIKKRNEITRGEPLISFILIVDCTVCD